MALNAQQKETKTLAMTVLEASGKDYDQALDEFHQEIISKNNQTILKALRALKKVGKKDVKEEGIKTNEKIEHKSTQQ
ncbi:hypothetical protein [Enterococcus hulanensis]|uniref:hypothetical protein n=1 Tax=Enterococcus hulanensis TaxID=2559929 RepID=UPI0010F66D0D|nr:hypothetical protein [Enterococcus hulanensis]